MPDITMCKNEQCDIREKCYRWCAKPSKYQSYALFGPRSKSEPCLDFVEDNSTNFVDQGQVPMDVGVFKAESLAVQGEVL